MDAKDHIPSPVAAVPDGGDAPPDRRAMLRLAAASLALAGVAAGCGEAEENLPAPLYARPRGVAEESPVFATALDLEGLARGVLVRTHRGRPVKVQGNPAHPGSLGATDPFMEAALLSLHDPGRSRRVRHAGWPADPAAFDRFLAEQRAMLAARRGEGLRLLTGPVASPTTAHLIGAVLAAFPAAVWHPYSPLAPGEDAAPAGARLAFGEPVAVVHDLARAAALLCLGADPLGPGPAQLHLARGWAAARAAGRAASLLPTLLVAEATPTLTGAKADRRLALRPEEIEGFARAVAAALGLPVAAAMPPHPDAALVAAALRRAGPAALVMAGPGQPPALHALVHAMNEALGAPGTTLRHIEPVLARPPGEAAEPLRDLAAAMAAGAVTHLVVLDANPVHDAPADLDFAALHRRVPVTIHAGLHLNETALASLWHLPLAHAFESWGDTRAFDGTAAIRQPATLPLVPAVRQAEALLAALAGLPATPYDLVRDTWHAAWGADGFEARWLAALAAGVVPGTEAPARTVRLRDEARTPGPPTVAPAPGTLTAIFAPDHSLWDGAFAENAWLQELPRPLSGLVWGNAALIAPATAAALGLAPGEEVALELAGRHLLAPVWPLPGQAPDTVTLPLGYGRIAAGEAGAAGRGFDAYRLRTTGHPWIAPGLTLRRTTGARRALVVAQGHAPDDGRDPVRVVAPGEAVPPPPPQPSLYPEWPYPGRAWGMAIDLDACIGCNACVIACQAENNVPVVGPEEAARGRIMHWLRVDRHHAGPPEAPTATHFQPVPCMHCEKAPCELACPVNATVHDTEGLNAMVYARCIGTRACSNNCPYKVRRFNWFDYARGPDGVAVRNPEVPLRPRGVMEKCTYCSHRIAAARAGAGGDAPLPDGAVRTACQEACPTNAIIFGDLNDPASAVARAKREGRNYALLAELNTQPRTTYLARVAAEPRGASGAPRRGGGGGDSP